MTYSNILSNFAEESNKNQEKGRDFPALSKLFITNKLTKILPNEQISKKEARGIYKTNKYPRPCFLKRRMKL
jgi:hypothetical protein